MPIYDFNFLIIILFKTSIVSSGRLVRFHLSCTDFYFITCRLMTSSSLRLICSIFITTNFCFLFRYPSYILIQFLQVCFSLVQLSLISEMVVDIVFISIFFIFLKLYVCLASETLKSCKSISCS